MAREFRRGLPRHRHDPRGARQLAQRSGGEGAGGRRARRVSSAACARRPRTGHARRKTQPTLAIALGGVGMTLQRHRLALCRHRTRRRADHADVAARRVAPAARRRARAAAKRAPAVAGRGLVRHRHPARTRRRRPTASAARIAYKTGTSYGYRDAWAIGYDGRIPSPCGSAAPTAVSTPGLMGRTAAAPILFDAFTRISEHRAPFAAAPPGVLQVDGRHAAAAAEALPRRPGRRHRAGPFLEPPVLISFPPDRAELEREQGDGRSGRSSRPKAARCRSLAGRRHADQVRPASPRGYLAAG